MPKNPILRKTCLQGWTLAGIWELKISVGLPPFPKLVRVLDVLKLFVQCGLW